MKCATLTAGLAFSLALCPAQSPFRVNVTLVQVEAVVTDTQGRHIPGLTPTDFEIYQDGRLQHLTHFSYVTGPPPINPEPVQPPTIPPRLLRQIAATPGYYLLAYRLEDRAIAGDPSGLRYHSLQVRVRRPNLTVHARPGFYTSPHAQPAADPTPSRRITAWSSSQPPPSPLPLPPVPKSEPLFPPSTSQTTLGGSAP